MIVWQSDALLLEIIGLSYGAKSGIVQWELTGKSPIKQSPSPILNRARHGSHGCWYEWGVCHERTLRFLTLEILVQVLSTDVVVDA